MSSAETALETAMLGALAADEAVRGLLGDPLRVIHAGAPKPAYPYLEIVRHEWSPASGAGFEAALHRIDLRTVSRDSNGVAAREAMAAAGIALASAYFEGPPPVVNGWRCIYLGPLFWDSVRMSDGSWRTLLRVSAIVEPG